MCGIVGVIGVDRSISEQYDIAKMINSLSHRGPDNISIWQKEHVGLAHSRLSIIDLSEHANQPQHYKHLHIVFNGEIFNFREIRLELENHGYTFETNGDTEVVLKAFHHWKEACVERFYGMFAFVIYDEISNFSYMFRDRVGIKPFYYLHNDKGFLFASEPRAFYPYSLRQFDIVGLQEYFSFGYIGKERTVYNDVKKLLPGHYIILDNNNSLSIHQYWSIKQLSNSGSIIYDTPQALIEDLEPIMSDAFARNMVSDVPVGIFLSGGIDSSLVTALLSKRYNNIATFTMGFSDMQFNEAPFAKQVAEHLNVNHHEKILSLDDAKKTLFNFYDIYDEPFADSSGIPTSLISKFAKESGYKVVLSADGGDELFGGYSRYEEIHRAWSRFAKMPLILRKSLAKLLQEVQKLSTEKIMWKNLGHKISKFTDFLSSEDISILYQSVVSNSGDRFAQKLLGVSQKEIFRDLDLFDDNVMQGMLDWDFLNYLPDDLLVKVDRATMYNGIEGREPMLDHKIVEKVASLSTQYKVKGGTTKYILKEMLKRHLPTPLVERPKMGFSIPLYAWFSKNLDYLFSYYLSPELINQTNCLDPQVVSLEVKKYYYFKRRGMNSNMELMWRLLSFMLWWEKYHQGDEYLTAGVN